MFRILSAVLALVAGCIAIAGLPDDASAQKRVAFVVGTDKYENLDKTRQLQRAVNDARAVGAAFRALGFEVLAAENLTRGQFNGEWQKFLDKLGAGDTAAIYYAGHGVEIEGLNFLLPRDIPDIKFGRQEQIKRESLSVAEILLDLRGRNPEIALVILDACRDNPLIPDEMRSAGTRGGGLAPLKGEPPKGTFIMYSAGAGESALDRLPGNDPDQRNSIFTRKLVPLLSTKGLALHDMARQLRVDVIELASTVPHAQRPAYYDGVVGKYCLAGCEGATDAPKRVEPTLQDRVSEAARTWETLRNSTNLADLEAFAARYRDTYFAGMAKTQIDELKKQQAAVAKVAPEQTTKRAELVEQKTALVQTPKPKQVLSTLALKAGDVHPLGYPTVEAVVRMGKRLEDATGGRISIQMFPSMQLGGEKEMIEQLQVGALQIARISVGPMGPLVPEFNVFNLPFVFRDAAHAEKVTDGTIGDELLKKLSEHPTAGLIGLCWMNGGTRNVYNSKRPIRVVGDLKGLKIRMMGNPLFVDTMNALGGNGVAMGFDQLVNAMQTGVVDGAENNEPSYESGQHYRYAKFYSRTGHLIIPELLVFSKKSWEGLSKDDQALIMKAAKEGQAEQRKLWYEREVASIEALKKVGVEINEVADKRQFQTAVKPVWDKYGAQNAALIQRIQAVQ